MRPHSYLGAWPSGHPKHMAPKTVPVQHIHKNTAKTQIRLHNGLGNCASAVVYIVLCGGGQLVDKDGRAAVPGEAVYCQQMFLQRLLLTEHNSAHGTSRFTTVNRLVILVSGISFEKSKAYGTLLPRKPAASLQSKWLRDRIIQTGRSWNNPCKILVMKHPCAELNEYKVTIVLLREKDQWPTSRQLRRSTI